MMKTISAASLAGVLFLAPACAIAETNTSETYRQLNLFGDVFERVRSEYVEPTTDEQLIETAEWVGNRMEWEIDAARRDERAAAPRSGRGAASACRR